MRRLLGPVMVAVGVVLACAAVALSPVPWAAPAVPAGFLIWFGLTLDDGSDTQ